MKFGKRILQIAAQHETYRSYYLDYKSLKKLLKNVREVAAEDDNLPEVLANWARGQFSDVADAEEFFMLALEGEFAKVESFFRSKVAELMAVFRCFCKRYAKVQFTAPLSAEIRTFQDLQGRLTGHPDEEDLISEFLEFVEDLDMLRCFVMTNAQALVKICKKHDKISPIKIKEYFITVLSRCTFYNSREFGGLIADVKVLSVEVFTRFTGQVPTADDNFTCEICSHVLCNPLELSCNHRFCNSCVSLSTFFGQHRCPVCFKTCVLTEEHMRVHTLHSHLETLVHSSSSPPPTDKQDDASGGSLRRNKSESDMSVAPEVIHQSSLRRNHSDSALASAAETCTLESPCGRCLQRSYHVQILRRESNPRLEGTPPRLHSNSSSKRIIIERIIKENEERSIRERRLSALSNASAGSAASLLRVIAREFAEEGLVEGGEESNASPQLRVIIPHTDPKLMTLKESEGNPWSPSKRWTACPEIFRTSLGNKFRRTSSATSLASEMWGKVFLMEEQHKHDRSVRFRLYLLELAALSITIFFCIRVGHPELLCPGPAEGERHSSAMKLRQMTVCSSWFGLMTSGGALASEQLDVANLQAQRTHSLHVALDNMVRTSTRK